MAKAKEEFKITGTIDEKQACILLNCKPTGDLILYLCCSLGLDPTILKDCYELLKECERLWGYGKYLSHAGMASAIVYVLARLHGESRTYADILQWINITSNTIARYKRMIILKFSFY